MAVQDLSLTIVRPDDLLFVLLEFENVDVTPPQAGEAGSIGGTANARLTVHLQPQHVAEEAVLQDVEDHQDLAPAPPGSFGSILAGGSRLVFDVPASETIRMTVEGVLEALRRLPLRVSAVNRWQPPGCLNPVRWLRPPPRITPPGAGVTALEAPYRLFLSPDQLATWSHAPLPVVRGDWTELWHTRLGSAREGGDPRVRAIWSPDFIAGDLQPHSNQPFRMSLDGRDRNEIVHLTSDYHIGGFTPTPVATEMFMLSTLGAWLKVEGDWLPPLLDPQTSLTVEQWRHQAMMARDQFVKVVTAGFLLPYGHRASLVKITERKFFFREDQEPAGLVAYLFQRKFIIVRQPTRKYSRRDMPLRSVTFKTLRTPNLLDSAESDIDGLTDEAFWPRVRTDAGEVDFHFHLAGTDWAGNEREWTTPLVFIGKNVDLPANQGPVLQDYNVGHAVDHVRRKRPFFGQGVAFAPAKKPGDTTLETVDLSLEAVAVATGDGPHFRPAMKQAHVDVPAVKQLLGKNVASKVEWEDSYLAGGGGAIGNAADVFLKLVDGTPLEFDTEKVGGMVAPDIGISGLSRSLGPVGGPVADMVAGGFDPKKIFGEVKLLGGITLADILMPLTFVAASTTDTLPALTTERDGDLIRTRYRWKLARAEMVPEEGESDEELLFRPTPASEFTLEAVVEAPLDGSPPTFEVSGALTEFAVVLLPTPEDLNLVRIDFHSVSFKAEPGKKPDVSVQVGGFGFTGILEFVNELRNHIPLDGFGGGPSLELVGAPDPGINVGFTLGIPTIGLGILTIQNISLSAGFFLPFGDADLNFHFGFCERQQPFILTVSLFGGGGFFGLDVGFGGVKMIEAALEFGASAAINLGVASGEASMMAGFYFQMAGSSFELTGYFRAHGSLSVLGIISVSLEFYLGVTYENKATPADRGRLWGQASLTVKIEILFFSVSVGVSMQKEFAGSDPKFRDMLTPGHWEQYVDSFAAYPA